MNPNVTRIEELYTTQGLRKLHARFLKNSVSSESDVIALATAVEEFIVQLFCIKDEFQKKSLSVIRAAAIHLCKRNFIERIALRQYEKTISLSLIEGDLRKLLQISEIDELLYAEKVLSWLKDREKYSKELEIAAQYALYMVEKFKTRCDKALFHLPKKFDFEELISLNRVEKDGIPVLEKGRCHSRDSFCLSDGGPDESNSVDHTNYCLVCHTRKKDSCRTGFSTTDGQYSKSPLGILLKGCPLRQKISEMNKLYSEGKIIAALSVVTLDNPMCAATGHRICNDCMRSCIYQKQEPVNVPGIETAILNAVLELPYGFEIYSLLTRWNPLRVEQPFPREDSGKRVLISGTGPAGFTLAHYLLNDGHTVIAVDGAKIEPLPTKYVGLGGKNFELIENVNDLYENLDERIVYGFGGVSEYGITVRWNKNYLKLIRILLERRSNYRVFGGVCFGSNISAKDCRRLGFGHVALCIGSGNPNIPDVKNVLTRGVRFASDFLMNLQMSGAFKVNSIATLQLHMPVVVIGAGLTAVDSATEALTYYKVQVEKFLQRYEYLSGVYGCSEVEKNWDKEEKRIAYEFLSHARTLRETVDKTQFLKSLGGVKIIYRKRIQDSPAYRLNFEELNSAMLEGIEFIEETEPLEIIQDEYGLVKAIKCLHRGKMISINARSVIIATGTRPNSSLRDEVPELYSDMENLSFFGDLDPKYSGSVVGAMASAKDKYPRITERLMRIEPTSNIEHQNFRCVDPCGSKDSIKEINKRFLEEISELLTAKVINVAELTENIFEIQVYAPLAAWNFMPGQFYKLQNFEVSNTFQIEPIALTGSCVDKLKGIISLIVIEIGASSYLCRFLKPGERIILTGPSGSPTEIPSGEKVLLIGGGLGNAVLFSIAKEMKRKGCQVIYFAGYKKLQDRFKPEVIEESSDAVVWVCDEAQLPYNRSRDLSLNCNMVEALNKYKAQELPVSTKIGAIDRIIIIGSEPLMRAVQTFIRENRDVLKPEVEVIASVNSPMQCMMKGVCAQCLQRRVIDGKEVYVYSCVNQDQGLEETDFDFLSQRLRQNSLAEKITYLYCKSAMEV